MPGNNIPPARGRSFEARRMTDSEFDMHAGRELKTIQKLKAQGKDTKKLEQQLAQATKMQRAGKSIPVLDVDRLPNREPVKIPPQKPTLGNSLDTRLRNKPR